MLRNELSDEQLIAEIREHDPNLYGEIIQRYAKKLTHYLRKFVRDNDDLEDVLQEVFIKAYKNLYGFNISKKFSSWIYRIAHNEALNHLKKHSRVFSLDEKEWEVVDEKIDLKDRLDQKINKKIIEEELLKIKEKYRQPLILYFFEEKSYEEIGDILRLPTSTVGTLISRAKKQLRESLIKKYEQPR